MELTFHVAKVFFWLFITLPLFDFLQQRFARNLLNIPLNRLSFISWYTDFLKVLRQSHHHVRSLKRDVFLRLLMWLNISSYITVLAVIPLFQLPSSLVQPFPLVFIFGILLTVGIFQLLIGFLVKNPLTPIVSLQDFFIRQMCLFVFFISLLTVINTSSVPLKIGNLLFPPIGLIKNPLSFLLCCICLAFLSRLFINNQLPSNSSFINPVSAEMVGTMSLLYRTNMSLEQFTYYVLLCYIFSGIYYSIFLLTLEIFVLNLLVLLLERLLPRIQQKKSLRWLVFAIFPLSLANYIFYTL